METAAIQRGEQAQESSAAWWATALFGAWVVARGVGAALAPMLLTRAPLALLILSPAWTNLILVSALVPRAAFVPVALLASTLQAAVGYQIGRIWGDRALALFAGRTDGALARVRRMVERAAPAVIFLIPGPIICTTAGVIRVAPSRFYPVMLASKLMWLTLCLTVGEALGEHIRAAAGLVREHLVALTTLALCLALGRQLRAMRAKAHTAP